MIFQCCACCQLAEGFFLHFLLHIGNSCLTFAIFFCTFGFHHGFSFVFQIFQVTCVRNQDAAVVFVKFDHLYRKCFTCFSVAAVIFTDVFGRAESFQAVWQLERSAFVVAFDHRCFVVGSYREDGFKGVVKNITNYGIFVELTEGVGGMVHISDLSWTKRYAHPSEFTKVGSTMDVVVLDIDKDKRQISLGHKQTQENPWDAFESIFPVGSYHEATVLKRDDKGATFQMPHGLEAFAPAKHIKKEDGQLVEVGEVLTVKVIEFNKDDRRILVSHSRYVEDLKHKAEEVVKAERVKESGEAQSAIAEVQKKVEKETLGDLAALAQLKEQLDKE